MNSPQMRAKLHISAVLLMESGKQLEWEKITRGKLLQLINKYKPVYVGTDNPNEILGATESLAAFCSKLPATTSIVHVNLTLSGTTVPMMRLLEEQGFIIDSKLNSLETARHINLLIEKGIGMKLEPFENETIIKINQPNRHKKGGWSQSRYERQNEEVVARISHSIEEKFREKGIDFDMEINKTRYGAKWGQFHVFLPKSEMDAVLCDLSFFPAKVKVWSPKKEIITHSPLKGSVDIYPFNKQQQFILGIDPGMETGVALLDLNGKLLNKFSRKNLSRGEIINNLMNYGTPLVVCADVRKIPHLVRKVAAVYNAQVYSPSRELSVIDKKKLTQEVLNDDRITTHEMDAIAAAVYFFKQKQDTFEKIDITDLSSKQKLYAKQLLVQGLSIAESIETAKLDTVVELEQNITTPNSQDDGVLVDLKKHLKQSLDKLTYYSAELERKSKTIKELRRQLDRFRERKKQEIQEALEQQLRDEVIQEKDKEIKKLRKNIDSLEKQNIASKERINELEQMLWLSMDSGGHPIKVLDVFSIDSLHLVKQRDGLQDDDILLIMDPTGGGMQALNMIRDIKLKFIFYQKNRFPEKIERELLQINIPFISSSKYDIRILDHIGMITNNNLELAIHDYREFRDRYIRNEKAARIEQTIKNYQYEREREVEAMRINYDEYEPPEEEI